LTADIGLIVLFNALMASFGLGLMPLLRIARTPRQLLLRSPLAYGLGLAVTGILGSTLELVRAPLGLLELSILALASLLGGCFRLFTERGSEGMQQADYSRWSLGVGLVSVGLSLLLLFHTAQAYAVRPLREYDGWVIWATKARALFALGGVTDSVFASDVYEHAEYPLLLPTLEAIALRALGGFDGTLVHLQLAGIAVAFVGAAWTISRATATPAMTGLIILAIVSAPAVLNQLGWNYADIPLGLLCALGVASLAAWLDTRDTWLLTTATVFLAAGALTKSEGLPFALAAFAAAMLALAISERGRLRPMAISLGAFVALILPWRIYVLVNDLRPSDYKLSSLADPSFLADASHRIRPATTELLRQMTSTQNWGLLVPLSACALATAVLRRRGTVAIFGSLWLVLSFTGLILIYWISELPLDHNLFNTSYRTTATLMLGSALLVPQLIGGGIRRNRGDA
jgi:hypothetical protein